MKTIYSISKSFLLSFASGLLLVVLNSCDNTNSSSSSPQTDFVTDSCYSDTTERQQFIKHIDDSMLSPAKVYNIRLVRGTADIEVSDVSESEIDTALEIATAILNSAEFQSKINASTFRLDNYCNLNNASKPGNANRITGKTVLDSLFRRAVVTLNLTVVKGRCRGALGYAYSGYDDVYSNTRAIECDMSDLPYTYAYAVHLCHEFAHTVGYCHTDHDDDVAEEIGWVAYYIAKNMVEKPKSK